MTAEAGPSGRGARWLAGVSVLALGAGCLAAGQWRPSWTPAGALLVLLAAYLMAGARRRPRVPRSQAAASGQVWNPGGPAPPGKAAWAVALALIPAVFGAYYLLHADAAHGGHAAWPLYLLAVLVLALACAWGYLFARYMGQ